MISILLEIFSKSLAFSLSSAWAVCWPTADLSLVLTASKTALSCLLLFYWGSCAMTGKGLLACIDLAWIGLALASLVWSEAQPGIGGQAVSLSCCQVASWHWAAAWSVRSDLGLDSTNLKWGDIFYFLKEIFSHFFNKFYRKKIFKKLENYDFNKRKK